MIVVSLNSANSAAPSATSGGTPAGAGPPTSLGARARPGRNIRRPAYARGADVERAHGHRRRLPRARLPGRLARPRAGGPARPGAPYILRTVRVRPHRGGRAPAP